MTTSSAWNIPDSDKNKATCRATRERKGTCESWGCRMCWDPNVRLVRYREH